MSNFKKSMVIDGVFASESLDTSGEILNIKGCDISDLENGTGVLNWEHKGESAGDILGKIIYTKKIFGEKDCEDERQLAYWHQVKLPMIYGRAELFDGEGHPGAVAAAGIIRYYHRRGEPLLARFSIEGSTMERDGSELKRSFARRVALTIKPCNRACHSGVIFDEMDKAERGLFKGEYYQSDLIVEDAGEPSADTELEDIQKAFERKPEDKTLEHYSSKRDLTEIHPKFHGTGTPGQEVGRRRDNPDFVDRSYYYEAGTKPEASLKQSSKYTAKLPDDAKIYDLAEDPDGYVKQAMEALSYPVYNKEHSTWIESKMKEDGYFGYKHSGSALPGAVALFHPLKPHKVQHHGEDEQELAKTLTLGGYGGAPSSRTGGAALQTEQWADGKDRRKKPEDINKARAQVLSAFRDWDRVTPIRKFLKHKLPDASDRYIERFANIVDDYQVKKAEQLFRNLGQAFSIGRSVAIFEDLKKQQGLGRVESYVLEIDDDILELSLVGDRIKVAGGDYMPMDKIEGFFDLIKKGEAVLKKKESKYVYVDLHGMVEIVDHHKELAYTYLESVTRSLSVLASRHAGEVLEISNERFKVRFDTQERASAFASAICEISASIGAKEHAYTPEFNVAIGDTEEEAEEKLHESAEGRQEDEPHSITGLEKAYKYDPSIPDFDIATLKNVYRNHVEASAYHKLREGDHEHLPPMSTEQRKARSQHGIDKAKASVAHTSKVLELNLGKFAKTPGEKEKLIDQLHTELLMEEGFIPKGSSIKKALKTDSPADVPSEDSPAAGEFKFQDQKHLDRHLSTEDFALISPHSKHRSTTENAQHHEAFMTDIAKHPWTKVKGMFDDPETSYMVHGIDKEEASKLAQKYDQYSHIQSSGGAHGYHSHKEHDYNPPGGSGHKFGEFDNYFSQIDLADGTSSKFQLDLEGNTKKSEATFDVLEFLNFNKKIY